jgi:invasion protein IalB
MDARIILTAALALGVSAVAAEAASPSPLGTFKEWSAYTSTENDGKMCFIAAQPKDTKYSQKIAKRGPTFFMITNIPAKKIRHQASTIIGYPFKGGSKVVVAIDKAKFTMFTDQESAWIENPAQEAQLLDAMRKGTTMTVEGTSIRGTTITDSYSLSGISAALEKIETECK